jgi:hypothetical protein
MPLIKEMFLDSASVCDPYGAGGEPSGEPSGVPGTDVEIGGGSPVPGPSQGEPDTDEARARLGIDRAIPVRLVALRGFREGGSGRGHRCVVVANESEAP